MYLKEKGTMEWIVHWIQDRYSYMSKIKRMKLDIEYTITVLFKDSYVCPMSRQFDDRKNEKNMLLAVNECHSELDIFQ